MIRAAVLVAMTFVAVLSGCGQNLGSPAQSAVRSFLKENLQSGDFEEVKWFESTTLNDGAISIRLKYRSKNRFGAMELSSDIFHVKSGKVVNWYRNHGNIHQ
jgi:hypothetical protein